MSRISRDQMLMDIAEVVAKRGTCNRLQVGAVISKEGRIISTGYNGVPSGLPHCNHLEYTWQYPYRLDDLPDWMHEFLAQWTADGGGAIQPGTTFNYNHGMGEVVWPGHKPSGCDQAEHAERNAVAYAARYGHALEGSEIHLTHAPCLACARVLIGAGITRVVYRTPYRLTEGVELLSAAYIGVHQYIEPEMV